ncbi:MAG: TrmB family transcriptional regulator [Planctomycetota bacterium]|jgi:sugar-specific transcriptional regulator TrmB
MPKPETVEALMDLGFKQVDAEVYALLLGGPPSTGYRIAQALGKPAAGVYKAIESLANLGAIVLDDGDTRLCRAVPYGELLRRLERQFATRRDRAAIAMANIDRAPSDDRIYQLRSRDQVLQRCREMLARCRQVALFDIFPDVLLEVLPDLRTAVNRGVDVAILVYEDVEVPGADVILSPRGSVVFERWPGQWLKLVIDASEYLYAFVSNDSEGVHQAVWTSGPHLAWLAHSGLSSQIVESRLAARIANGAENAELKNILASYERLITAPGYAALLTRFGLPCKGGDTAREATEDEIEPSGPAENERPGRARISRSRKKHRKPSKGKS